MIYSNACGYAIQAMSRLAMIRPEGYLLLGELCEGTDLPRHFVAKIFQDLVRRGLLVSAKGRGGGFALARKPGQITLYQIVEVIDGVEDLERCVVGLDRCDDNQPCPQHEQWKTIRGHIKRFLTETSLEKMARSTEQKLKAAGLPKPVAKSKSKPVKLRR